ncbi:unnamed protein product [Triticum turgidum subsp. durum]|uniref:Uncharacterized protein n=1 Tax=Triticum turgidum subsp. durum TaxID=4567 RepID=A0A9R1BH65_TRITD|nr:unnamed protein product [Triticum turgidum subsp. durum]
MRSSSTATTSSSSPAPPPSSTRNATSRTRISGSSWTVSTSATRAPSRRSRVRKPSQKPCFCLPCFIVFVSWL